MEETSFILYTSYTDILQDLSNEELGLIFKAILVYKTNGQIIDLPKSLLTIFRFIKNQLDIDKQKWEQTKQARSSAGKLGGAPKGNKNAKNIQNSYIENKQKQTRTSKNKQNKHNENDNVNVNVNDNVNVNKKESIEKKEFAVKTTNRTPQQEIFDYFAKKYKANTQIEYLAKAKDFVLVANLLKKFNAEQVKQKIDWLEVGCKNAVFWFSKDINDFSIGCLYQHWNEILPKLTDEQKQNERIKAQVMAGLKQNKINSKGEETSVSIST